MTFLSPFLPSVQSCSEEKSVYMCVFASAKHLIRYKTEKAAVVQCAGTAEFCCRILGWQARGCAVAILGGAVED